VLAAFANFEMVAKVNDKLPDNEKLSQLGWYFPKTQEVRLKYRTLYPDGRLLSRVRILTAIMFVCLFIAAWGFGVFAKQSLGSRKMPRNRTKRSRSKARSLLSALPSFSVEIAGHRPEVHDESDTSDNCRNSDGNLQTRCHSWLEGPAYAAL
jgi:hypothetical protein